MARAKGNVVEDAAVLAKRDFTIGAAIQVIENRPWKPATSQGPEIVNTNDVGRCYRTCRSSHWQTQREGLFVSIEVP